MNLEELEVLAETAAVAVSNHIAGSFVDNDGGASYVYLPLPNGHHAIAFVDTLEQGEYAARWTVQYDEEGDVWQSKFLASSPSEDVATWVNAKLATIA